MYRPGISLRIGKEDFVQRQTNRLEQRIDDQQRRVADTTARQHRHRDSYSIGSRSYTDTAKKWAKTAAAVWVSANASLPRRGESTLDAHALQNFILRWGAFESGNDPLDVTKTPRLGEELGLLNISTEEARHRNMTREECFDAGACGRKYLAPLHTRALALLRERLEVTPTVMLCSLVLVKYAHGAGSGAAFKTVFGSFSTFIPPGKQFTAEALLTAFLGALAAADGHHYKTTVATYGPIHARNAAFVAGVPKALADIAVPFGL